MRFCVFYKAELEKSSVSDLYPTSQPASYPAVEKLTWAQSQIKDDIIAGPIKRKHKKTFHLNPNWGMGECRNRGKEGIGEWENRVNRNWGTEETRAKTEPI